MSKIPLIEHHYRRALRAHGIEASDAVREMFCAGVATGIGLGNTVRDDLLTLHVDKVEELNLAVVDAMEFGGGAPDEVDILRERVRQDAENYRQNGRTEFEA